MKKYIKPFIFLLGVTFTFTSCQEELVSSEDYRIEYDESKAPALGEGTVSKVSAGYAILKATADADAIDRGFLLSKSETDFSSAQVISVENDAAVVTIDGTSFELKASNLSGQTTYYYRPFASNFEGGTVLGTVQSFTTRESATTFSISYDTATEEDWNSAGFTTIDIDGDGNDWALGYYDEDEGQIAFVSYSWSGSALTPDNYLVFPEFVLDGVDGTFSFSIVAGDPDWYAENVKVVIHDSPITEANAAETTVLYEHTLANENIFSASVDIPESYEGESVYIALVHADVSDYYNVYMLEASFSFAK